MAVAFSSGESYVNIEIGDYQPFPNNAPVVAAIEKTPKSKLRHVSVVLVSFGLLCVLQGVLNITLRLATPTDEGGTQEGSCSPGWIPFDNSCYSISSRRGNWDDSRWNCFQRGADLAIITSRQEQAFLSGLITAAWVGMTDREKEGTWIWVDRTPVMKDRLQWARGQPDGSFGGEDCGTLYNLNDFIGLNDDRCIANFPWICEKALA